MFVEESSGGDTSFVPLQIGNKPSDPWKGKQTTYTDVDGAVDCSVCHNDTIADAKDKVSASWNKYMELLPEADVSRHPASTLVIGGWVFCRGRGWSSTYKMDKMTRST